MFARALERTTSIPTGVVPSYGPPAWSPRMVPGTLAPEPTLEERNQNYGPQISTARTQAGPSTATLAATPSSTS